MPKLNLKDAIKAEGDEGIVPNDSIDQQLKIISGAKKISQTQIEKFLHGEQVPGLRMSDLEKFQKLAVYRMNKGLPVFPYKLKVKPSKIYPFY